MITQIYLIGGENRTEATVLAALKELPFTERDYVLDGDKDGKTVVLTEADLNPDALENLAKFLVEENVDSRKEVGCVAAILTELQFHANFEITNFMQGVEDESLMFL